MTTITAFYNALAGLAISGVKRRFPYPPRQVTTADLPAQWVQLPDTAKGGDAGFMAACSNSNQTRQATLIVVTEAAGQSTNPTNVPALLGMMDAIEAALWNMDADDIAFTQAPSAVVLSDTPYWGVVVNVVRRE